MGHHSYPQVHLRMDWFSCSRPGFPFSKIIKHQEQITLGTLFIFRPEIWSVLLFLKGRHTKQVERSFPRQVSQTHKARRVMLHTLQGPQTHKASLVVLYRTPPVTPVMEKSTKENGKLLSRWRSFYWTKKGESLAQTIHHRYTKICYTVFSTGIQILNSCNPSSKLHPSVISLSTNHTITDLKNGYNRKTSARPTSNILLFTSTWI